MNRRHFLRFLVGIPIALIQPLLIKNAQRYENVTDDIVEDVLDVVGFEEDGFTVKFVASTGLTEVSGIGFEPGQVFLWNYPSNLKLWRWSGLS
jgi:hypothetical protein